MNYLVEIGKISDAPLDAFILSEKYILLSKDYISFARQWIQDQTCPVLNMNLSSLAKHSLIFHLTVCPPRRNVLTPTYSLIQSILTSCLITIVPNFTYCIAIKENCGNLLIYLPEFLIGYDDYVLLCEKLNDDFNHKYKDLTEYKLEILENVPLKDNPPYVPVLLTYVDDKCTIPISIENWIADFSETKKQFKSRKDNSCSIFKQFYTLSGRLLIRKLKEIMMPLPVTSAPYTLAYRTNISTLPSNLAECTDIGILTLQNKSKIYISKNWKLLCNSQYLLKAYHYLKLNTTSSLEFDSANVALKTWYDWFLYKYKCIDISAIPELFHEIHFIIYNQHPFLSNDKNPLKTVLEYNDGYYFLPMFNTLHNYLKVDVSELVHNLLLIVDAKYHVLLHRLKDFDQQKIPFLPKTITLNTLHYCCDNMYEQPNKNREKLKIIINNNQNVILSTATHEQLIDVVRNLQERNFPILNLKIKNNLKKDSRFIWNFLKESWQEIILHTEVSDHMTNLWSQVRYFLTNYHKSGGLAGPSKEVYEKLNVSEMVSAINSDTSMERKEAQMESDIWLLRMKHGVLHLLTGHIGGVVPEYYLLDRKIGIEFSRSVLTKLCTNSPHLIEIYTILTSKRFFLRFLKALLMDEQLTLFDTAYVLLQKKVPRIGENPFAISMLHFFVHLSTYMTFEYELFIYMMDLLASTLIATNYERKFIVWKGPTRNGKSMMFELLKRVFGGYFFCIQSENFQPVSANNAPSPELVTSLFSGRIVACEELDGKLNENRVKQITGNSHVSFRNLYEQNSGGIPTAKVFASTNNYPDCRSSIAFRDRTIAIPFEASFVDSPPKRISDQVRQNKYSKKAYVIEKSYQGCFLMLYYHLQKHMDPRDGLLHYRKEPPYVVEFTQEYLIHTNVYVQFKVYMDVQIIPGTSTFMQDLKSAIRQFLKSLKSASIKESDLIVQFDEEFGQYRRMDTIITSSLEPSSSSCNEMLQFSNYSFDDFDDCRNRKLDEGGKRESGKKKEKINNLKEQNDCMIYYENITIRNLKTNYV